MNMVEMKRLGSALLGVLAVISLGFGLALGEISQTFGQQQCHHRDMACPKSDTHSLLNIVTSLIGPIWRK
jgi:hypothetical protein